MEAAETREKTRESAGEGEGGERKGMAAYVAALAAVLAIASLGGNNSAKDMLNANIAASDTYAFYQSKVIRQTEYRLA